MSFFKKYSIIIHVRGLYMNLKRFNALTTLEACMIMLFVVLLYIYNYQQNNHVFEKESYRTTARVAYDNINAAAPLSPKDEAKTLSSICMRYL